MEPSKYEISSARAKQRAVDIFEFLDTAYKTMSTDAKRAVHLLQRHLDFDEIEGKTPKNLWDLRDSFKMSCSVKEVESVKQKLDHWKGTLESCLSLLKREKFGEIETYEKKASHMFKYMTDLEQDIQNYFEEAKKPPVKEVKDEKIKFFDPHFHLFDSTSSGPSDNKLWDWLYPSTKKFQIQNYEQMMQKDHDIEFVGGVAIEATSVPGRRLEEASWLDY
jgi:hypothetical protein